jgi:hypothetical protein
MSAVIPDEAGVEPPMTDAMTEEERTEYRMRPTFTTVDVILTARAVRLHRKIITAIEKHDPHPHENWCRVCDDGQPYAEHIADLVTPRPHDNNRYTNGGCRCAECRADHARVEAERVARSGATP